MLFLANGLCYNILVSAKFCIFLFYLYYMFKISSQQWTRGPVVTGLALFCCLLWGSATPCIKVGYQLFGIAESDTATILLFAGCRFALAGLMSILMGSLIQGRFLLPHRGSARPILALSLCQTVWQYFFFYIGLAHASGVKSAIIVGCNVFISILMASLIFRMEPLTRRKLLGCLAGFGGVVCINWSQDALTPDMSLMGEGFVFLAMLGYALSSVLLKRYGNREDPVTLSGYQFLLGGLVLAGIGLSLGGHLTVPSLPALGMLLYLAFVSAAAYSVWALLLKYNPVSRVTIIGFTNPVFGVLLSAVLLGESEQAFRPISLAALLLVCVGIWIVNRPAPGQKS